MKQNLYPLKSIVIILGLTLVFSSCKNEAKSNDQTDVSKTEHSEGSKQQTLTDAQISLIMLNYLKMNFEFAHLALKKTNDPTLKHFANSTQAETKKLLDKTYQSIKARDIEQKESETDKKFLTRIKHSFDNLQSKEGSEFDRSFYDDQLRLHHKMINISEEQLLPNSDAAVIKDHLKSIIEMLKKDMDRISKIREKSK